MFKNVLLTILTALTFGCSGDASTPIVDIRPNVREHSKKEAQAVPEDVNKINDVGTPSVDPIINFNNCTDNGDKDSILKFNINEGEKVTFTIQGTGSYMLFGALYTGKETVGDNNNTTNQYASPKPLDKEGIYHIVPITITDEKKVLEHEFARKISIEFTSKKIERDPIDDRHKPITILGVYVIGDDRSESVEDNIIQKRKISHFFPLVDFDSQDLMEGDTFKDGITVSCKIENMSKNRILFEGTVDKECCRKFNDAVYYISSASDPFFSTEPDIGFVKYCVTLSYVKDGKESIPSTKSFELSSAMQPLDLTINNVQLSKDQTLTIDDASVKNSIKIIKSDATPSTTTIKITRLNGGGTGEDTAIFEERYNHLEKELEIEIPELQNALYQVELTSSYGIDEAYNAENDVTQSFKVVAKNTLDLPSLLSGSSSIDTETDLDGHHRVTSEVKSGFILSGVKNPFAKTSTLESVSNIEAPVTINFPGEYLCDLKVKYTYSLGAEDKEETIIFKVNIKVEVVPLEVPQVTTSLATNRAYQGVVWEGDQLFCSISNDQTASGVKYAYGPKGKQWGSELWTIDDPKGFTITASLDTICIYAKGGDHNIESVELAVIVKKGIQEDDIVVGDSDGQVLDLTKIMWKPTSSIQVGNTNTNIIIDRVEYSKTSRDGSKSVLTPLPKKSKNCYSVDVDFINVKQDFDIDVYYKPCNDYPINRKITQKLCVCTQLTEYAIGFSKLEFKAINSGDDSVDINLKNLDQNPETDYSEESKTFKIRRVPGNELLSGKLFFRKHNLFEAEKFPFTFEIFVDSVKTGEKANIKGQPCKCNQTFELDEGDEFSIAIVVTNTQSGYSKADYFTVKPPTRKSK